MKMYDLSEIAELFKVSVVTIARMKKAKTIPQPLKIGRKQMWVKNDVDNWILTQYKELQTGERE